jgi:hypothetical protein
MLAVAACTPHVDTERVPTEGDIRSWSTIQPFLVEAVHITGVYENDDIDSILFHYRSTASGGQAFWHQVDERATAEGWVGAPEGQLGHKTYYRLRPRGQAMVSSAEEVRVLYTPSRVVVGWIQSDQPGEPRPVAESSEGRFAERVLWPKFEALVGEDAG